MVSRFASMVSNSVLKLTRNDRERLFVALWGLKPVIALKATLV
jgi:hypothetical protein